MSLHSWKKALKEGAEWVGGFFAIPIIAAITGLTVIFGIPALFIFWAFRPPRLYTEPLDSEEKGEGPPE